MNIAQQTFAYNNLFLLTAATAEQGFTFLECVARIFPYG